MRTAPINRLDAQYMAWRNRNPKVYNLFKGYANKLCAQGRRFGIEMLVGRVRWEAFFATDSQEDYKICQNYAPYLSRDLAQDVPGFSNLVRTKALST